MKAPITEALLTQYEAVAGDLEQLPVPHTIDPDLWELVDHLLLDLHLVRHGYADAEYERHVDRRLRELCASEEALVLIKALKL